LGIVETHRVVLNNIKPGGKRSGEKRGVQNDGTSDVRGKQKNGGIKKKDTNETEKNQSKH